MERKHMWLSGEICHLHVSSILTIIQGVPLTTKK